MYAHSRLQPSGRAALPVVLAFCAAVAWTPTAAAPEACAPAKRTLNVGFFAHYSPVSYSADRKAGSAGFNTHRGYEADLLTALEAMKATNLSFSRSGIDAWDDIWLKPAGSDFDLIGGGITALESRTRDAKGMGVVMFTSGHITFRQSLLVRASDAKRFGKYSDLGSAVLAGAFAGTTGEARLLQLTGIADGSGRLAAGTKVATPRGVVVADGSDKFVITAGRASAPLAGRLRIVPAAATMPQVILYSGDGVEAMLVEALRTGQVDAIAGGVIGNRDLVRKHSGALAVTALDDKSETGGFTVAAKDTALAACLNANIDYLTDGGRVGYKEWSEDQGVFMARARKANAAK